MHKDTGQKRIEDVYNDWHLRVFRDFNHVTVTGRSAEEVEEVTDAVAPVPPTHDYDELCSQLLQLQKQLVTLNQRLVGTGRVVDLGRKTSRATDPEERSLDFHALGYWSELLESRQQELVRTMTGGDLTILPTISTIAEPIRPE